MNDTIYRQDAINLLRKRLIETANNNVGFICDAGQAFEDASERIRYWIDELPSAQSEVKEIGYDECADAMLKMWIDNVLTDGEYNRIMDKLNKYWGKVNA